MSLPPSCPAAFPSKSKQSSREKGSAATKKGGFCHSSNKQITLGIYLINPFSLYIYHYLSTTKFLLCVHNNKDRQTDNFPISISADQKLPRIFHQVHQVLTADSLSLKKTSSPVMPNSEFARVNRTVTEELAKWKPLVNEFFAMTVLRCTKDQTI